MQVSPLAQSSEPIQQSASLSVTPELDERVQRIVIVGMGYVGLPSAICLARAGYHVTGADINAKVVDALRAGRTPLPDSVKGEDVQELVEGGRLEATLDTAAAVREADFVIVAVPTPVDEHHQPDLTPLRKASEAIGRGLRRGSVVSFESTTFPGCTERECIPLLERESGLTAGRDFGVSYCPERLSPGDHAHSTEVTPRVLGALDARSLRIAKDVYESFLSTPLHLCKDIATAECSKVLENIQRDVNIALINEFAMLAPELGLDAHEVLRAASTKFNFMPIHPGPGVGGHCIPVDPHYLIKEARRVGFEPRLMATARSVNDAATEHVSTVILSEVGEPKDAKVAVLGISYKGGVGDVRESPALRIVKVLRSRVREVVVFDPYIEPDAAETACGATSRPLDEAVAGAHAIVVLTDHPEYRSLDWAHIAKKAAPGAIVLDSRNVLDPAHVTAHGFRHWSFGRGRA